MRYKILGVAQTEDHGTVVTPGGPRLRALLAALALRPGQVVTPDTLIDEVWADAPPQDAPGALQALVGRLRRTVGKDAVASAPGGYRLAATRDDVDLYVFERLVRHGTDALDRGDAETAARHLDEALGLWRGPALADLAGHAARPEALHLEATRARVEAGLRLGDAHDAVPRLYELTAAHPYDEPLRALLIRALRAAGRDADALAAYEDTRRTLAEGLGTEPGPALRSLHAELLAAPVPHRPAAQSPRTGNIRPRLTSFVGREAEIDAIRAGLRTARLVTLTGPGGSGKTRLAEEAAAALPQAWLVELAPLDRPEAVPGAVVNALGLRETVLVTSERASVQDDPVASLVEYCASRDLLLVLDNCEHLVGAVARLAETLLTRCPGLTVLATSREPLGVPGEAVRPVEPLAPDQAQRLFAARAAAVRPDADAVLGDEEAVAEICRRLDGLPLAIELAAARLRLLTPREIADRLDDRFRLLTSGSRTVLPRQQTLRAVVDWSWDLLDEAERTMLRALSVFAGGWDLEAAEAVGTGPAADLVGALVDKSLVVADPGAGGTGMRYRMLETIHEYADERAAELPGPRAAAERAHRAWARALAEEADPRLRSAGQLPWIARLETEHDNIRAALGRSLSAGDEEEAAALALAMGWFWWLRNYRHEGVRWFDRVLCLGAALDAGGPGDVPPRDVLARRTAVADPVEALLAVPEDDTRHPLHFVRMRVRMMHILLTFEAGPGDRPLDERMRRYVLRVRNHFAAGGPEAARVPGIIWPLTEFFVGESNDVRPAMDASVANCRVHGGEWEIAASLMFRAHAVVDTSGDVSDVDEDLGELRLLSRRLGDRLVEAQVCSAFGEAAMVRGRYEEARTEYGEALRLAEEVGAFAESPFLIARLAEIAYRSGDRRSALAVLDEASVAADRYGVVDSKAFVLMLRAGIAVEDEDFPRARALWAAARDACERGTPPPQFLAMLGLVEALVTAGEAGPGAALPLLADTVRTAVDDHCADLVVATLVDSAAGLLSDLGDHARAALLLGAAGHWRGDRPAPAPDRAHAERAADAARAALGAERYAAERARGAGLATADAVAELDAAPRSGPGHRSASRVPTRR
ncbi:BTAD domain-containing putative transcriptional regulator [Streptomyces olivaceus]|uniref:BTAD domain-containing putative transcriptional regulator n=1 Tax=Streptomyces olivaceus TaxID=47716 RepID=UPI0036D14192